MHEWVTLKVFCKHVTAGIQDPVSNFQMTSVEQYFLRIKELKGFNLTSESTL